LVVGGSGWVLYLWAVLCNVVVVVLAVVVIIIVVVVILILVVVVVVVYGTEVVMLLEVLWLRFLLDVDYPCWLYYLLCMWYCLSYVVGGLMVLVLVMCSRMVCLLGSVLRSRWHGYVWVGLPCLGSRWWSLWYGALLVFWTCSKKLVQAI
jgi:hypothetical protein